MGKQACNVFQKIDKAGVLHDNKWEEEKEVREIPPSDYKPPCSSGSRRWAGVVDVVMWLVKLLTFSKV